MRGSGLGRREAVCRLRECSRHDLQKDCCRFGVSICRDRLPCPDTGKAVDRAVVWSRAGEGWNLIGF